MGDSQRPCPPVLQPPSGKIGAGAKGNTEPESPSHTTSPLSQRVNNWARFTTPDPDAHVDAPSRASTTLPPSPPQRQQPHHGPPNEAPLPLPTMSYDVTAEQLKHLETLVDSVLATVAIIQAASHQPVAFSAHTQEALKLLNKLVVPATAASSSTTTCPAPRLKPGQPTMPLHSQAINRPPLPRNKQPRVLPSS